MNRKALIVEDEEDLGQLLAEHLRRWGFEPTHLLDGEGVVDWVRLHKPTVILLDLMLPGMDGWTICETLKLDRSSLHSHRYELAPVGNRSAAGHIQASRSAFARVFHHRCNIDIGGTN